MGQRSRRRNPLEIEAAIGAAIGEMRTTHILAAIRDGSLDGLSRAYPNYADSTFYEARKRALKARDTGTEPIQPGDEPGRKGAVLRRLIEDAEREAKRVRIALKQADPGTPQHKRLVDTLGQLRKQMEEPGERTKGGRDRGPQAARSHPNRSRIGLLIDRRKASSLAATTREV